MASSKTYVGDIVFQNGTPHVVKDYELTFSFSDGQLSTAFVKALEEQNKFPGRKITTVTFIKEVK